MSEALTIQRSRNGVLRIVQANGVWQAIVNSSEPLSQAEYDQVAAHVGTGDAADALLGALRRKMGVAA